MGSTRGIRGQRGEHRGGSTDLAARGGQHRGGSIYRREHHAAEDLRVAASRSVRDLCRPDQPSTSTRSARNSSSARDRPRAGRPHAIADQTRTRDPRRSRSPIWSSTSIQQPSGSLAREPDQAGSPEGRTRAVGASGDRTNRDPKTVDSALDLVQPVGLLHPTSGGAPLVSPGS